MSELSAIESWGRTKKLELFALRKIWSKENVTLYVYLLWSIKYSMKNKEFLEKQVNGVVKPSEVFKSKYIK